MVLIFHLISQLGANRVGSASSRGIHFQIYWCADGQTLTLICSLLRISLLRGFRVASKISSWARCVLNVCELVWRRSGEMVFSYEVQTLTLDLFPSELIALKMPGFNPPVLQLHSFPSVEENDTTFPQPIFRPVASCTAAKGIWARKLQRSCRAKFAYSSVIGLVAAGIHQMLCSCRQWFRNPAYKLLKFSTSSV